MTKIITKTILHSVCLLCLMATTACQQEEVLKFDPELTGLNIWVGTEQGSIYEEATYNYSYALEEGSVTFYARVYGVPVDYDRTFTLEPFGNDINLVAPTIRTEEYVMPAGEVFGEYKVYFNSKKLPLSDLFTETDGAISFRMANNGNFKNGAENMQSFNVVLRNRIAKPDNWDGVSYPWEPLSKYFGSYSRVKYQFMIDNLALNDKKGVEVDFRISYSASTAIDEANNIISTSYAVYLKQMMQEELAKYNATHETPLTDENGDVITF